MTGPSFWPQFWVRNRLGTAGVRKGRGQGSVREMGKNPVPVRSYNSKTGERGWH